MKTTTKPILNKRNQHIYDIIMSTTAVKSDIMSISKRYPDPPAYHEDTDAYDEPSGNQGYYSDCDGDMGVLDRNHDAYLIADHPGGPLYGYESMPTTRGDVSECGAPPCSYAPVRRDGMGRYHHAL